MDDGLGEDGVGNVLGTLPSWIAWRGEKGSSCGSPSSGYGVKLSVLEHRTLLLKNMPLGT